MKSAEFRRLERDLDMTLCGQVVDLVRLHLLNDPNQVGGIGQVAIMENQASVRIMRALVQVINPVRIKKRGPPFDTMDFVPFLQKELREVGSVLPCYPCDQRSFQVSPLYKKYGLCS